MAHERGHVDGDIGLLDRAKELRDVQRRAAAIAGHNGGDAHADEVLRPRHVRDVVGVGVDVNEPGRNDQACRVNFGLGIAGDSANASDAPVLDGDVGEEGRVAGAVHDPAMADDHVVGFGHGGPAASNGRQQRPAADRNAFHRVPYTRRVLPRARARCS